MRVFPLEPGPRVLSRALALIASALVTALAAGCSNEQEATVRLNVAFPSTAMAIASDDVKFIVFDDPTPGACQRIYLKWITGQSDLPPVVFDAPPIPVCALAFQRLVPFVLPLGRHSILAVATRSGEDLLVGCSDVALSSEGGEVVVDLALPGATPLPPTSECTTLRDWCEERCE